MLLCSEAGQHIAEKRLTLTNAGFPYNEKISVVSNMNLTNTEFSFQGQITMVNKGQLPRSDKYELFIQMPNY